jgi:hypothetical protein
MGEVLSYLAPFAVFAGAVAVLYATGVWRPRREAMTLRAATTVWSSPPMSLFGAAWLLVLLAMPAFWVTSAPRGALPLGLAGVVLLYGGCRIAGNSDGWADALARRVWTDQGFRISHATQMARVFGATWVLLGGAFLAIAVGAVI